MTPYERCSLFVNDIVEVCKKHKVMIAPDDFDEIDVFDIAFVEHGNEQFMFHIGLVDLERAIRENVWPIVHGAKDFPYTGENDESAAV